MKKNLIIFFLAFFMYGKNIFAEQIGNGFLGVNFSFQWEHYRSIYQNEDYFLLPISFSGVALNYDIMTDITITPEILHIDKYYSGKFFKLNPGALQPYSFANLEVLYKLYEWEIFHFNGGLKMGHYGFMSNDWTSPAFTVFIAPKGSIFAFLGDHFMVQIPLEIPLGIYTHNLNDFFMLTTAIEVNYDPIAPISNPVSNSAFFCLGMEYSYLNIQTADLQKRSYQYLKPYAKITILY